MRAKCNALRYNTTMIIDDKIGEKIEESRDLTENIKQYAHPRIKFRIIAYIILSLLMIGIAVYDIAMDYVGIISSSIVVIIGLAIGYAISRMFHISWDHEAELVVSRLDTFGVIILIAYIFLELRRTELVGIFVNDGSAYALSFILLTGIMIGRVLGIRRRVQKILDENL